MLPYCMYLHSALIQHSVSSKSKLPEWMDEQMHHQVKYKILWPTAARGAYVSLWCLDATSVLKIPRWNSLAPQTTYLSCSVIWHTGFSVSSTWVHILTLCSPILIISSQLPSSIDSVSSVPCIRSYFIFLLVYVLSTSGLRRSPNSFWTDFPAVVIHSLTYC